MILISKSKKLVIECWTESSVNNVGVYSTRVCSSFTPFKDIQASFTSVTAWVKYLDSKVKFI